MEVADGAAGSTAGSTRTKEGTSLTRTNWPTSCLPTTAATCPKATKEGLKELQTRPRPKATQTLLSHSLACFPSRTLKCQFLRQLASPRCLYILFWCE